MTSQFNDVTMTDQTPQQQCSPSYLTIPKIRVIVRKRPLSKKELAKNDSDVVDIRNHRQVVVKELKTKVDLTKFIEEHSFNFDLAFNEQSTNEQIYIETVRPMIEAAFNKTKVTCFAYGQTGSGKTFTMMGSNGMDMSCPGMYLLAAYDIFTLLQQEQYQGFTIWASFYEIYCGKLFDLLNERNLLTAREDGKQNICIVGLTEKNVCSLNELMMLIQYGLRARTVGVTGANSDSSRSHGIIQIVIKNNNNQQHGKISFIDLAGSERAADTIDTNKQTRIDGAEINKSLLALKECIRALDQDKKHTPFRGSKLTLVLRDSFVGNCKTLMIANISPSLGCSEHTLNTLRYADRVKELRGKPDINIGSGNVNLNYENSLNNNKDKDPQEVLANLLMMPRQHNNTLKYKVDSNMKRISEKKAKRHKRNDINRQSSLNTSSTVSNVNNNSMIFNGMNMPLMSNNFTNINMMNYNTNNNQIMNNSCTQFGYNNNNNCNILSNQKQQLLQTPQMQFKVNPHSHVVQTPENKENIQYYSNANNVVNNQKISNPLVDNMNSGRLSFRAQQQKSKIEAQPVQSTTNTGDAFSFLNDYTSFTQKSQNENAKSQNKSQIEEDLNALREQYEILVNKILTEEKDYIESHKKHIDDMVHTMKSEMNLINTVEKQANVDEYVDTLLNVFTSQEEQIKNMKERLINFKSMLKEESELSGKIAKISNDPINTDINLVDDNIKMEGIEEAI